MHSSTTGSGIGCQKVDNRTTISAAMDPVRALRQVYGVALPEHRLTRASEGSAVEQLPKPYLDVFARPLTSGGLPFSDEQLLRIDNGFTRLVSRYRFHSSIRGNSISMHRTGWYLTSFTQERFTLDGLLEARNHTKYQLGIPIEQAFEFYEPPGRFRPSRRVTSRALDDASWRRPRPKN